MRFVHMHFSLNMCVNMLKMEVKVWVHTVLFCATVIHFAIQNLEY